MTGRAKVYEASSRASPRRRRTSPKAFNVMVQEMRGLALDVRIFDAKGKQIALTERDEDMINKQRSDSKVRRRRNANPPGGASRETRGVGR